MQDHSLGAPRQRPIETSKRLARLVLIAFAMRTLACASGKLAGGEEPLPDGALPAGSTGGITATGGSTTGGSDTSTQHPPSDAINTKPATGSCDPVTNVGCPSGQKCTALQQRGATFAMGCDDIGSASEGEPCTQEATEGVQTGDNCGSGLSCFQISGDTEAKCHHMCLPSAATTGCTASQACDAAVLGLSEIKFCRAATPIPNPDAGTPPPATCKPLAKTGCSAGQACYLSSTGTLCMSAGSKTPGSSCGPLNDCTEGNVCVSTVCRAFCSTAVAGACKGASTGGSSCKSAGSAAGEDNLGFCNL